MKELKPLTKQKQQKFSLGLSRVKPLTLAVCTVLAGTAHTASAGFDQPSPYTISTTVTLPSAFNVVRGITPPATITVTSEGVLNYPDSNSWLYCAPFVVTRSIGGNIITSYGTINGSTSYSSYLDGGFLFVSSSGPGYEAIHANNNKVTFKAGSSTKNVEVYGAYIADNSSAVSSYSASENFM